MSARLDALARLRAQGGKGVVPYITAGDGGLETTLAVLHALERAGAAAIEVGLPFSDPVADGPVLQAASNRSLAAGTTLSAVLDVVREFRSESELPLVLMTYVNPLIQFGLERALERCSASGFDGVLTVDLPLEEAGPLRATCRQHGLAPIFFATPTGDDTRLAAAGRASRGFLYAVGRLGVTGARAALDPRTADFLARARRAAGELPLAVGFGLSSPEQVASVLADADLAIVGSALVAALHHTAGSPAQRAAAAAEFLAPLVDATRP